MLDQTLSEGTRGLLKLADQELSRSVQVATRMLRFHRQSTAPSLVDLSEIMDSALALDGNRLSSNAIQVKREYLTQDRLRCMKDELRQTLDHLISNSMDAIKGGGLGPPSVESRALLSWGSPLRISLQGSLLMFRLSFKTNSPESGFDARTRTPIPKSAELTFYTRFRPR